MVGFINTPTLLYTTMTKLAHGIRDIHECHYAQGQEQRARGLNVPSNVELAPKQQATSDQYSLSHGSCIRFNIVLSHLSGRDSMWEGPLKDQALGDVTLVAFKHSRLSKSAFD